jgi:hypothetical protein
MSNDDQVFVSVTAADLRGTADEALVVEPGADRRIAFSVEASRAPGSYDAVLGFELVLLDAAGEPVLRGELTTPELPLGR